MRLDLSNLLVAVLVISLVEAGPLRARQEDTFLPSDTPECPSEIPYDPQETASSPVFCLPPARKRGPGSPEPSSADEPEETQEPSAGGAGSTGGTSDEPTGPPASSAGETSPAKTDEPPAADPQTVVVTETVFRPTTVVEPTTVAVTTIVTDEDGESAVPTGPAEECEDEEETDASSGVFAPSPSSPAGTGADTSGIATDAPTEGTDPSTDESPSPITTGADDGISTVEVTAPIPTIPSSGASTGASATPIETQPESSGAASSDSPENTIIPTGTPNPDVPTAESGRPTAVTTVSPEVMESNLEMAKALIDIYADLTPLSACSEGQIACVEGSFAKCNGGAFDLQACPKGSSCLVLPLDNVENVIIMCATEEEAAVLGDAVPSGIFSGSAGPTSGGIATGVPSGGAGQTSGESVAPSPSEGPTEAPSQPGDSVTTTITEQSTVTITSTIESTRGRKSTVEEPGVSDISTKDPEETPPPTDPEAPFPTTVVASEIESEAPSIEAPSSDGAVLPTNGASDPVETKEPNPSEGTGPVSPIKAFVEDLVNGDNPTSPSPSSPIHGNTGDDTDNSLPSPLTPEDTGDDTTSLSPSAPATRAAEEIPGVTTVLITVTVTVPGPTKTVTKTGPTMTVTETVPATG